MIINTCIFVPAVQKNTHYMMIFDAFVILTCLTSLILCTRSVVKGIRLQRVGITLPLENIHILCTSNYLFLFYQEFVSFFLYYYKKEVSFSAQMEFVNGWYILIIVSDVLTIVGSTLKMEIQAKVRYLHCQVEAMLVISIPTRFQSLRALGWLSVLTGMEF